MQPPRNPMLDPTMNDDLDDDGNLDVEWYPLPDWLIDADKSETGETE